MPRSFSNALTIAAMLIVGGVAQADEAPDFDRQIAPILVSRCFECHQGDEAKGGLDLRRREKAIGGGDSGASLVAGKPGESLLWQRVSADEMPPKKLLSADEKKLIERWIAGGAKWGTDPIDPFRLTTSFRAGYDWWSLRPVAAPALPEVRQTEFVRSPIDRFILAKLEAEGLSPSPAADRRTLIRRVYFDVTGLPPTPEEVTAFVADPNPQAYEILVDRLLASPAYGERWARHWLDLARFGESNGFEYDEPRQNAWPYRDWVIAALNADMPYDEFVRQQIAGDILKPDNLAAIRATGFLVAGPYDTAGQNQQSAAMKAVVRQDELEDLVATTCQTFLALTVNCARCHDHKFDPIRQSEYYRLTAALAGVRQGERTLTEPEELARWKQESAEQSRLGDELAAKLRTLEDPIRQQILAERKSQGESRPAPPAPLARWEFKEDLRDCASGLHAAAHGGAAIKNGALRVNGRDSFASTVPLEKDLQDKTLEVWVTLETLKQAGGGAISVQTPDGNQFDAIVFGEREPDRWMAGSNGFVRTQSFDGPAEVEAATQSVHVAIVYDADGTITAYRNGQPYGKSYRTTPPVVFKTGHAQVVFGMRHAPAGGNRMLSGAIHRAQLYDRALSADEVAASFGGPNEFISEDAINARLTLEVAKERQQWKKDLAQYRAKTEPPKSTAYAVKPRQPEIAHVLARGDTRAQGEVVSAGGVASLVGLDAEFGLAPDAPEGERRVALARWITSPQNPLFARVAVNRLWHYHFGAGLVDTPNDFGFNGGRPTHPELLDWLADALVARGYSLKQMHREILLSGVYCQSGKDNPTAAKVDAGNHWLWRRAPQRLEAEAVRDATLVVAAELNSAGGGPGFRDTRQVLRSGSYSYVPTFNVEPEYMRRSVYRTWIRGGRNGLLDVFDCPDPSTTSPKRAVTTTPLQALALLNNAFVLRMAERFALRIEAEAGANAEDRVTRAYQLAYGRDPTDEERNVAAKVVSEHGTATLTRAIVNSNEFLYVD